LGKPLN